MRYARVQDHPIVFVFTSLLHTVKYLGERRKFRWAGLDVWNRAISCFSV